MEPRTTSVEGESALVKAAEEVGTQAGFTPSDPTDSREGRIVIFGEYGGIVMDGDLAPATMPSAINLNTSSTFASVSLAGSASGIVLALCLVIASVKLRRDRNARRHE